MPDVTHFTADWAAALGRSCWQGGLAILLAWLICRCLPRLSPRLQCWLWRLAYLKLLVTLFWITPLNLPLLPSSPPSSGPVLELPPPDLPADSVSLPAVAPSSGPLFLLTSLFCLWLAGCVWRLWQLGGDLTHSARLRRRSRGVEDRGLLAECRELCGQLALPRRPQLRLSEGREGPLLIGLVSPAILLPEALWNACTPAQQRLILAHELAHLKRRDLLWAWVPGLSRCLFFFHPLVWLAEREWQQSQEMACDEQVLRLAGASRSAYGDALLKVALQPAPELPSGLVALRVAESYTTVRRRLLAMKHAGNMPRRTLLAAGALVAALGLIGIIPWRVSAQEDPKKEASGSLVTGGEALFSVKIAKALNLSDLQIGHLKGLHEAVMNQINQVLTPDQQKQLALLAKLQAEKGNPKEALHNDLGLTAAQLESIKSIHANTEQQARAVKEDGSLSPEAKAAHMKALAEADNTQINQILTPEQQQKIALQREKSDPLKNDLNLSPAQSEKLDALKKQIEAQMQALQQDASLSKPEIEVRMKAIKTEAEAQFTRMLTPEQQKRLAQRNTQPNAIQGRYFSGLPNLELLSDLTDAQKTRIRVLYQNMEKQFQQTLTPEQQQKLQQLQADTTRKRRN